MVMRMLGEMAAAKPCTGSFPVWAIALALMVIMTGINMLSVGSFGEAEYCFAGIKVVAIVAFIVVAALFASGIWPGSAHTFSNMTDHGGLLPNGLATLFIGVVVVIFSMTGVEVVTIVAAESAEPAKAIRKAVSSVVFRILAFFAISTFLIVMIVPWSDVVPGESPDPHFAASCGRWPERPVPTRPDHRRSRNRARRDVPEPA